MRRLLGGTAMVLFVFTLLRCSAGTTTSTTGKKAPFVCWTSADRCDCKPDTTVPTDGTAVANCSTKLFGYCCQYSRRCGCDDNPGCGTGGREVATCENDYPVTSTKTCPGSGFVSCSSSADCPCGLICSRLSTSSAEKWCTQSCDTDSDCSNSSLWTFSGVGCNPLTNVCTPGG